MNENKNIKTPKSGNEQKNENKGEQKNENKAK